MSISGDEAKVSGRTSARALAVAARFGPVPGSSWEPPAVSQQGACEAGSPVTAVGVACSGVWGPRAALVGHVLGHVQGCVKAGAPVGCEVRPQLARNSGMEKRALSRRREAQVPWCVR